MKIGVITSGVDMLVLFRFLAKQDFSYHIVYDDLGWPWSDKPFDFVMERAEKAIEFLIAEGCEKIIVPPLVEVALHQQKKYEKHILPLRNSYVVNECLFGSPIGKIGFAGEYVDMQQKEIFESLCKSYQPNEKQQERWNLSFWWQEITMWKYYLTKLSFKSEIVHHAMKADWRYFKDAGVDTIIPTSYGFFAYEVALGKFLHTKKQRFHRLAAVEKQFAVLTAEVKADKYAVQISYTWTLDHLKGEKKWIWMLERGKEITIQEHRIILS